MLLQAEKHFKPEFLNRLSEIVVFEPLSQNKMRVVANVQMQGIIAHLAEKGINIIASEAVLDIVLSESHNPVSMIPSFLLTYMTVVRFLLIIYLHLPQLYGARPIRRWLQKNVMTKLAEMLVTQELDFPGISLVTYILLCSPVKSALLFVTFVIFSDTSTRH